MPWKSFWFGTKYAIMFQIMYWIMAAEWLTKPDWREGLPYYVGGAILSFIITFMMIAYLHKKREDELVSVQHREV